MSFTSQPRKYDLGEIAYFPWSWNPLNSTPITNESGTWIPAAAANPTLGTRMTATQRAYLHSIQNPLFPIVGVGIPIGSAANNIADITMCNVPSTFDNGTPPKLGSRVFLNFMHNADGLTANASGAVLTGENIYYSNPGLIGTGTLLSPNNTRPVLLVTSNPAGTGFCALTMAASNSGLQIYASSDGITWTLQSQSGFFQQFYNIAQLQNLQSGNLQARYTNGVRCGMGYHVTAPVAGGQGTGYAVIYVNCGARILCIIPRTTSGGNTTATHMTAWLSSDGFNFSNDQANSVLGTTNVDASSKYFFFHRNNNACFLIYQSSGRITTDGGVTWSSTTGLPSYMAFIQTNTTNRASLIAVTGGSTQTIYVSTDTGANWTTRTLPAVPSETTSAISYAGNIIVYVAANGSAWVSTNDGASWSQLTNTTLGVPQNPINIVHDGFRFYMLYQGGNGALSTSTNGTTWTARTIPATSLADSNTFFNAYDRSSNNIASGPLTFAAASNSSDVVITTQSIGNNSQLTSPAAMTVRCYLSNDGGVTWYVGGNIGASSYNTSAANSYFHQDLIAVNVTGSTTATRGLLTGNTFIPEQHIDNLGHRFTASQSNIVNTTLTGQIAFVKIG